MTRPFDYCPSCGEALGAQDWPLRCEACESMHYANPTPVAVLLQPVGNGLLTVRRDIEPRLGQLALPGGFIDLNEDWQDAAVRELAEETGLSAKAEDVDVFNVVSAPDGTLLVFGIAPALSRDALDAFEPNAEVSELVVVEETRELAFPLHTDMLTSWLQRAGTS